jgi:hypothetical protein
LWDFWWNQRFAKYLRGGTGQALIREGDLLKATCLEIIPGCRDKMEWQSEIGEGTSQTQRIVISKQLLH